MAHGWPGIEPRWARGAKDGVGTAYSASSRVWFTVWNGIVTEVFYPTVDRPQIRDLQLLVSDGETFFHEEKRHLRDTTSRISDHALAYVIQNDDPQGRYTITKEVITDPHLPCVLQHIKIEGDAGFLERANVYVLCAPHLDGGGWGNNARVVEVAGRDILVAEKGGTWLALAASVPFERLSVGYVGASDGWTDLADNFRMDWEYDAAPDGNVALTGLISGSGPREFVLGLAFGHGLHDAVTALLQSISNPFPAARRRYVEQWDRSGADMQPLEPFSGDNGMLYHSSYDLLLAHEDKTYPGAVIASMSIPWGEARGDSELGGYHLVWPRDMVNSTGGLLAAGNVESARRALVYLAANQQHDGGFAQNFWIDGTPHWTGIQLDQTAFPILLAWRLDMEPSGAWGFDPYVMVKRAAAYIVRHGPATDQERWEEAAGYSPSTIASNIAALICAASFARQRGDAHIAHFLEGYADFLECHVESWTVTTEGTLLPGIRRHFIRILPANNSTAAVDDPNVATLGLANQPPGARTTFPAKEIVDAGFLELVRYGIRKPGDPLIEDSLRVVDATLKVETPYGVSWRRYNHDGYGQADDGGSFVGWGRGRAWPLLTGERAHYELAAGRDVRPLIAAMERFAAQTGMLTEQIWDAPDLPHAFMFRGKPTGAAMPLMWAHAEYIKLLRSIQDGQVFDLIPEVAKRYLGPRRTASTVEVWKPNRQPRFMPRDCTLRVQAPAPFRLRWSFDGGQTVIELPSTSSGLGIEFVDLLPNPGQIAPHQFRFLWIDTDRWDDTEYEVALTPA